jgi:hypothetical protein
MRQRGRNGFIANCSKEFDGSMAEGVNIVQRKQVALRRRRATKVGDQSVVLQRTRRLLSG